VSGIENSGHCPYYEQSAIGVVYDLEPESANGLDYDQSGHDLEIESANGAECESERVLFCEIANGIDYYCGIESAQILYCERGL
jgi:hypothetical protein